MPTHYTDVLQKIATICEIEGWRVVSNFGDDSKVNIDLLPKVEEEENQIIKE